MSFHPRQWHHSYLGLLMLGVGLLVGARWCWTIGAVLVLDDVIEHATGVGVLLWLYGCTLYRIAAVRRLNAWLDERCA